MNNGVLSLKAPLAKLLLEFVAGRLMALCLGQVSISRIEDKTQTEEFLIYPLHPCLWMMWDIGEKKLREPGLMPERV